MTFEARASRREFMSDHLAGALAADAPLIGTANLLPRFYEGGDIVQAALWLKAIYFDSSVVQTPEQAFAKAYDSMPGVRRPDFMEV